MLRVSTTAMISLLILALCDPGYAAEAEFIFSGKEVRTVALLSLPDSAARAGEDEPNSEEITKFAFDYMKQLSQQKMTDREIASQLASNDHMGTSKNFSRQFRANLTR